MKIAPLALASSLFLLASAACAVADNSGKTVLVQNPLDFDRSEVVAIPYAQAMEMAGGKAIEVIGPDGVFVPSQVTYDSLLIFKANVPAMGSAKYTIHGTDTAFVADTVAIGRLWPRRQDDLAWENDVVAFRAYGPGTQQRGEKMYGYDLFLKRGTTDPILFKLYNDQMDPENWKVVNALHAQGKHAQADSVQNSFTYHVDHGVGMDCYAVGATLGAGAAAPLAADSAIAYQQCFTAAEILDNGPLRFTARLHFAPLAVDGDTITETRIITLDAGENLNHTVATYQFGSDSLKVVAGIPLRGDAKPLHSGSCMWAIDPTQGPDNGLLMIGCVFPDFEVEFADSLGSPRHMGAIATLDKTSPSLSYYWGYGWDRANVVCMPDWGKLLTRRHARLRHPLTLKY